MNRFVNLIVLCLSVLTIASCSTTKKDEPKPKDTKKEMAETQEPKKAVEPMAEVTKAGHHPYDSDWGYEESNGPKKWGDISKNYQLCKTGQLQSPVNLKWAQPQKNTRKIELDYKDAPLQVIDNGHSISVKFPPGSKGYFGGKQFELINMHFHTSSEHTLSGNQLPMEAHLVHKNELGQIAVVGLFLIEGRFNPFIEKIWTHIPKKKHSERLVPNLLVNAKDILPSRMTYYFYVGSLTTPPCTEGVRWHVLNTPVEVSRDQIIQFRKFYQHNNRPVQALKSRNVINY